MHTKHTRLWVLVAHTHVYLLLQGNHPISFHFIIHYAHYTLVQALNNVKCGQLVSIQHRHSAMGANQKQVHFADAAIMVATTEGWTAVCAMWATKATELGQKAALEGKYIKAKAKDGWQCAKLHMCRGILPQTDTHSMITVNFRLLVS